MLCDEISTLFDDLGTVRVLVFSLKNSQYAGIVKMCANSVTKHVATISLLSIRIEVLIESIFRPLNGTKNEFRLHQSIFKSIISMHRSFGQTMLPQSDFMMFPIDAFDNWV